MSNKVRFGIIGGGMIGVSHIKQLQKIEDAEVTWLVEVNPEVAKNVTAEFKIANVTGDYSAMLAAEDVDAVIVGTPPHLHKNIGIDTLRAGKHMLMEKPLSLSVDEAQELVTEARKHTGLVISGCSARHARLNPKFDIVKKLIDDGALGDIYHIHQVGTLRQGRPGIEYNPGAKWFLEKAKAGGGPMLDWGVYDLSFHLGILGEPKFESVQAVCINGLDQHFPKGEGFVEEHGYSVMKFRTGLTYYWERANNAHTISIDQTRIYGKKGGLVLAFPTWCSPLVTLYNVDKNGRASEEVFAADVSGRHEDIYYLDEAFVKAVQIKGPVPMSIDIELENLRIISEIYKAANW